MSEYFSWLLMGFGFIVFLIAIGLLGLAVGLFVNWLVEEGEETSEERP